MVKWETWTKFLYTLPNYLQHRISYKKISFRVTKRPDKLKMNMKSLARIRIQKNIRVANSFMIYLHLNVLKYNILKKGISDRIKII